MSEQHPIRKPCPRCGADALADAPCLRCGWRVQRFTAAEYYSQPGLPERIPETEPISARRHRRITRTIEALIVAGIAVAVVASLRR